MTSPSRGHHDGASDKGGDAGNQEDGAGALEAGAALVPVAQGAGEGEGDEADWIDAEDEDIDWDDAEDLDLEEDMNEADFGSDEEEEEEEEEWGEDDEEELNEWAQWMEEEADALSQSSEEPDMEHSVAADLVAGTSGRIMEEGCVAYRIPTAHYHFQSADALALAADFCPSSAAASIPTEGGSSLLLATFDKQGVAAWLAPVARDVQGLGREVPVHQAALRLGGFQHPSDIFTMTCSPDGRYIITGGEAGILTIYTVDPSAPPRPTQRAPAMPISGVTYFYTPIGASVLQHAEGAQHHMLAQLHPIGFQPQPHPNLLPPEPAPNMGRQQQQQQQQQRAPGAAPVLPQQQSQGPGSQDEMGGGHQVEEGGHSTQAGQSGAQQQQRAGEREREGGELDAQPGPSAPPTISAQAMLRQMARLAPHIYQALLPQGMLLQDPAAWEDPAAWAEAGDASDGILMGGLEQARRHMDLLAAGVRSSEAGPSTQGAAQQEQQQQQQQAEDDGEGSNEPQGGEQAGGGQRTLQPAGEAGQPAAVMMSCMVGLGLPEDARLAQAPFNDESMLNGVRVGLVAGKQRLVAAEQSGHVYVLELPPSTTPRDRVHQHLMCSGLGAPSPRWRMLPVSLFRGVEVPAGVEVRREGRQRRTAAIGPFGVPVNMAVPSPDGRWLAVVGDSQSLFLVDQAAGFSWTSLDFDVQGSKALLPHDMSIGAQYCAWHPSSSLLAVTSDGLHATFVFNTTTRQQVYRVEGHTRPCLGVMFAPWDPDLLIYNEETKHIFLRGMREAAARPDHSAAEDFAQPSSGVQLLRAPLIQPETGPGGLLPFNSRRRRITGMAASSHGDLFVATKQGAVLRYFAHLPWSLTRHQLWPLAFREQARQLLLCSHRQPQHGAGGVGLWCLPGPVVLHIIQALAGRRAEWMGQARQ